MASIGSPKCLQELANGAVYLQMISNINPKIIPMASINSAATTLWESFQNFTVLSRLLEEKGFCFTFDVLFMRFRSKNWRKQKSSNTSASLTTSSKPLESAHGKTWPKRKEKKVLILKFASQITLLPKNCPSTPLSIYLHHLLMKKQEWNSLAMS